MCQLKLNLITTFQREGKYLKRPWVRGHRGNNEQN
jgi:hypothetical protein